MKAKQFFIFLIAFVLIACNPVKQITQSHEVIKKTTDSTVIAKTETKTDIASKNDNTKVVEKTMEQFEKETTTFEAVLVTYDTTKPIEAKTGKPPVLSELTVKKAGTVDRRHASKENQTDSDKSDFKSEIKQTTDNMTSVHIKSADEKTEKQTLQITSTFNTPIIIGVIFLIIIAGTYFKKSWIIKIITQIFK